MLVSYIKQDDDMKKTYNILERVSQLNVNIVLTAVQIIRYKSLIIM